MSCNTGVAHGSLGLMQLRITIAMCMVEIRNRKTIQSKVNICKSDVKIGDYADSLPLALNYSV